jgi:hypothetical protein
MMRRLFTGRFGSSSRQQHNAAVLWQMWCAAMLLVFNGNAFLSSAATFLFVRFCFFHTLVPFARWQCKLLAVLLT